MHLPRQGEEGGEAASEVGGVEVLEVGASAVEPLPCGCHAPFHVAFFAESVGESHFGCPPCGVDGASLQGGGACQVHAADEGEHGGYAHEEASGLVERCLYAHVCAEVPVAVHAERLVGVYACGGVVEVAHGQFVLHVAEPSTSGCEGLLLLDFLDHVGLQTVAVGVAQVVVAEVDVQRVGGIADVHEVLEGGG